MDLIEDSVTSSRAKVLDREAIPYIRLMAMAKPVFPLQMGEKNETVRTKNGADDRKLKRNGPKKR